VKSQIFLSLLIGDPFLVREKRKQLVSGLKKDIAGDITETTVHLQSSSLDQVLAEARTLPFLITAQIFYLEEAHVLKKHHIEMLATYFEKPSESSYFIFESSGMDKKHPLLDLVKSRGRVFLLEESSKRTAVGQFMIEKLKAYGKTIRPEAVRVLEERMGDAPIFLDSILEQLINFSGEEKVITEGMLDHFEENWKEIDVFKLTDALAQGNTGQSLVILNQLAEGGETEVISLLGILHWNLKRFWRGRVMLDEGQGQDAIFKVCRIYGRQGSFFMRQLKAMPLARLEKALQSLFHLDWQLKTGRREGHKALEPWIVQATT